MVVIKHTHWRVYQKTGDNNEASHKKMDCSEQKITERPETQFNREELHALL